MKNMQTIYKLKSDNKFFISNDIIYEMDCCLLKQSANGNEI